MRILIPGVNKPNPGTEGFIMLRGLLVIFIVIICFSAAIAAMAVLSRHSSTLIENTEREITRQNAMLIKWLADERY